MTLRSTIFQVLAMSVAVGIGSGQTGRLNQNVPWPPESGSAEFFSTPPPGYLPDTVGQLCASSRLIIDGYVQSTAPARKAGPEILETDSILLLNSVLKGVESSRQIVVAQRGGVAGQFKWLPHEYSLMQAGEHYIMFLTDDKRPGLPQTPGVPRYAIARVWAGLFRIDGTAIHLSRGVTASMRQTYEGATFGQVVSEIGSCSLQAPE